jgi:DUF438 domain-containing protein
MAFDYELMYGLVKLLRIHGYVLEIQQRDNAYAVVLPLDGNYVDIDDAVEALDYFSGIVNQIEKQFDFSPTKRRLYEGVRHGF